MAIQIERHVIHSGYDRKTCWVHPRPGIIPGQVPSVVVTLNKLRLSGMDVFYALADMRSDDAGATWSAPHEHSESLGRRALENGTSEGISDFWPMWHEKTGVLLGTGHTVLYGPDDNLLPPPPRHSAYSVYCPESQTWKPWKTLDMPGEKRFLMEGAGSTQRFDLPDGDVLLPTYYTVGDTLHGVDGGQFASIVVRCRFDGETLEYIEHGNELTDVQGSGFCEPSLAFFKGRFYLTLRNDDYGAVAVGDDGLHFGPPRKWTFDEGSELGNYRTQQHWVTMGDALYLVYTRRGANNDHILWNRAPLFIAQVDPERLCIIRETEQVLVPERGARLCNFGVAKLNDNESWVTVAEWMQTTAPDHHDYTICERYGSDNSIYLAKIRQS